MPQGSSGLGTRVVGTHRQMFQPLLKLMILLHCEGRPTGKSSETAFAYIWLQLAIENSLSFSSFS